MPVRENRRATRAVRRECGKNPGTTPEKSNPTNPITTLQPERGNLVAKYYANPEQIVKPLWPQFETKYDVN